MNIINIPQIQVSSFTKYQEVYVADVNSLVLLLWKDKVKRCFNDACSFSLSITWIDYSNGNGSLLKSYYLHLIIVHSHSVVN